MKIGLTIVGLLLLCIAPQPAANSDQQMCLCEFVAPIYPPLVRLSRDEGEIRVRVSIDVSGIPEKVEVLRDGTTPPRYPGEFERPTVEAIKRWRFCPSSVESNHGEIVVTVRFKLLTQTKPTQSDQWFPTEVTFRPPATVEITTTTSTVIAY